MNYAITLEDDKTGDLFKEVVDADTRKGAVKTVNKKFGKEAIVIGVDIADGEDTVAYKHVEDQYEVLIGDTDDQREE